MILRSLITFSDQGADAFFGEPEFDTADLLRVTGDGRGVVSLLELPNLQDRPAVFSTFLMWLLADLFHDLPEVGDVDKPKLVFFFDEAHLLFADASKAFLTAIAQTVRLIRSKGVGIFFVTQTPKDVPDDVLAQLGSRVQHQLRAHTPNDAKALKQTVATFPRSDYDLAEVLQQLGIGEAVVTVMDPDGAPTPVAWTRMRAAVADGADAGGGAAARGGGVGADGEVRAGDRPRLGAGDARPQAGAGAAAAAAGAGARGAGGAGRGGREGRGPAADRRRASGPGHAAAGEPAAGVEPAAEGDGRADRGLDGVPAVRAFGRAGDRPRPVRRGPPPLTQPGPGPVAGQAQGTVPR